MLGEPETYKEFTMKLRHKLNLALLGAACTGGSVAQVELQPSSSPYYIGASQAFTREDNIFRTPEGQPEISDTYSTTSLLAGVNQPIGRQRLFANAALGRNIFRDNSQLNNTTYDLDAGLDWATIDKLSGTLSYATKRNLARYGVDDGPTLTTEKNEERSQQLLARIQYGMASLMSLEGTAIHRELDYSAASYAFKELKQDSLGLRVLYHPSGLLTLGAGVRGTDGRYPFAIQTAPGVFEEDAFDRRDFDLSAVWTATGLSRLTARLSYSKEDHDRLQSRDFSGVTGALSWAYAATGKLNFITDLIRDTGSENSFNDFSSGASTSGNTNRVSNAVRLRATYDATAKIRFGTDLKYQKRDLVNTFTLTGGTSTQTGEDKTTEFSLTGRYKPTRNAEIECGVGREKRTTSSPISYPYSAGKASCSAQLVLQ
jgi:hypothetical protein